LVNQYITVNFCEANATCTAAIVEVAKKKKLSFVRDVNGTYSLYTRQGNSTRAISLLEVEEFILLRSNSTE
jgi:hypothetical protein